MTIYVALGALALGLLIWLLSAVLLNRNDNEVVFAVLFTLGLLLTAAGFFYFLPVESVTGLQRTGNLLLYIGFLLGVNWGLFRWLHR